MAPLFGRRRGSSASRSSGHLPLDRSTSMNAATAASQAFLARPPSSGALSAAAAAAALRSLTTTPEPVGNLQTKRMVRRGSTASNASNASGSVVGNVRPGLQRRTSSGSMTERSFRSPSPGRLNGYGAVSPSPGAPPVPAIPRKLSASHQRANSLEPPRRVTSPTPAGDGTRAMSMDRSSKPPSSNGRKGPRLSNVAEELERSDSNRNINFSRPRNSNEYSPTSPTQEKQYTHGTGAWFSEPVSSNTTPQSAREIALEQKIARIQAAAGQPVKASRAGTSAQGTHLSRSNSQSVPSATYTGTSNTSKGAAEFEMKYDPGSRKFIQVPKVKPTVFEPAESTPAPRTYDPNTRTIVAAPEQKRPFTVTATTTTQNQRPHAISVDTKAMEPPPRNPARLSPASASPPQLLHKQPSLIREEPEKEDKATTVDTVRSTPLPNAPTKSYITPPVKKQRSSSLDVPVGTFDRVGRDRAAANSPSPQRSARFSASPVIQPTRHEPPPRDISPAKSALKHSPSSSLRTTSPLAHFSPVPKSPVSETSDTASQASQDAFSARRKKSVRVSFDEQPLEIEAPTATPTRTIIRERSPALDDLDNEEVMKPRPALPSFGSVRKQRVASDVPQKAAESQDASSDHAIGGILKNAKDSRASDPLPPDVTSKESAGYISDESDDLVSPTVTSTSASREETKIRDFAVQPDPDQKEDVDVPAINLLPPTPGIDVEARTFAPTEGQQSSGSRASAEIKVPGGWNKFEQNQAETSSASAADPVVPDDPVIYQSPVQQSPELAAIGEDSDDSAEFSDAAEDLSELDNGGFASLNAIAVSPVVVQAPPKASVELASPPASPSVQQASKKVGRVKPDEAEPVADWGETTAYWSRLSKSQREQIEREHLSSDDESHPPPTVTKKAKKKTALKQVPDVASDGLPSSTATPSTGRPASPNQHTMRTSMRTTPGPPAESEVHMRKSMRAGGAMPASLRNGPAPARQNPAELKNARPNQNVRPLSSSSIASSTGLPATAAARVAPLRRKDSDDSRRIQDSAYPRIQPRPLPKPQPRPAPVMTAKLQKEFGNDSDSESSFKKRRQRSNEQWQGKYTMKRSMRGASEERAAIARPARLTERRPTSPTPGRGDSFSIRSLSPSGSLFGRKKRGEEVRQSLRGKPVESSSRSTLRNGPPAKSSLRPSPSQQTSRFRSRFADSDDEEDNEPPRGGMFRSRFGDSDDEDDVFIPADLTPVRGIPRRQGQNDGDSTDLEDEDDDDFQQKGSRRRAKQSKPFVPASADIDKAMEAARKKLGIAEPSTPSQQATQGAALQNGSLRGTTNGNILEPKSRPEDMDIPLEKKKRGLMGTILRRNRGSTTSVHTISSRAGARSPEVPASPLPVASPSIMTSSPLRPTSSGRPQSPTSPKNKLVRRSSVQQDAAWQAPRLRRGDSTLSTATAPASMGDHQDWPLPSVPTIPSRFNDRPNTSDGGKASVRFEVPDDESSTTGKKKKKKFGMLRRAFKLDG